MAMRRSCVKAGVYEVALRRRLPKLLCNRSVKRAVTQVLRRRYASLENLLRNYLRKIEI